VGREGRPQGSEGTSAMRLRRAAAVLFAAATLGAACGSGPAPERPNLIFLTVDTLRADHMRRYGYARDTMPSIEAFAERAVTFDNAVVPRGITRPSYASMLTGLYPYRHGVRSNFHVLHEDLETLAERLRAAGYHTAGFVSNATLLGESSGMAQGFDVYDDRLEEREAGRQNFERSAPHSLAAILAWLEAGPRTPFFLFTNFIDPHGPYTPPESFREMFRSEQTRLLDPSEVRPYQRVGDSLDFYDYVDRYDGEIRYADEALGILLHELERRGFLRDALVVFTADHGESMGEHRIYFEHHSHVWEETMRVPLIVRLPREEGVAARRVDALASPMDLPQTVLDLLGLDADGDFDGRSLLPLVRGESGGSERDLLLEFPHRSALQPGFPDVFALRTRDTKLIWALDPKSRMLRMQMLYDVRRDPLEQQPLPTPEDDPLLRELARRLRARVAELDAHELPFTVTEQRLPTDELEAQAREGDRAVEILTPAQAERLRSLGYAR